MAKKLTWGMIKDSFSPERPMIYCECDMDVVEDADEAVDESSLNDDTEVVRIGVWDYDYEPYVLVVIK